MANESVPQDSFLHTKQYPGLKNNQLMCDSFVERCFRGTASPDEIDDYIEMWHESDSDLPLHEYLGLSWSDYAAWARDKAILPTVIANYSPVTSAICDAPYRENDFVVA